MPVASVGEVELSYERSGSGPPLLLIMGMSGSRYSWGEPFLEALRREFEVIAFNNRGIGDSSRVEEPFTIAQLAQDTNGLLAELELDSVDVMGISMGGMVAQELALAHPERIRTLTLGCTYCGGAGSSLASPAVGQRLLEAIGTRERERVLRTTWEICISPRHVDDAALYEAFRAIGLEHPVAQAVVMLQMQAIGAHDTSARLSQLELPTLVVHGTADDLIPVENAGLIAGYIPAARLEILDGAGHMFFWEEPARSAELVVGHAAVHA
jgi:3-oxoadipate enol-lactonase